VTGVQTCALPIWVGCGYHLLYYFNVIFVFTVCRCGLKSVTDRLYSRHCADTWGRKTNQIKPRGYFGNAYAHLSAIRFLILWAKRNDVAPEIHMSVLVKRHFNSYANFFGVQKFNEASGNAVRSNLKWTNQESDLKCVEYLYTGL